MPPKVEGASPEMLEERRKMVERILAQSSMDLYSTLEPHVKRRVDHLKGLQEKNDELDEQYKKEMLQLQQKYRKLCEPLWQERAEVVRGAKAVEGAEGDPPGVPSFWRIALTNSDLVADSMAEADGPILDHLTDITADSIMKDGEPSGFKLTFHFSANPFFTNTTLTKTYRMLEGEESVLEEAEGCAINWAPGQNPAAPKKGGKKKGRAARPHSFFRFFSPPVIPQKEISEEKAAQLQEVLETDYEMGAVIRDMISSAVQWYLGEVQQEDSDEEYEESDEDDDEDDDDEDQEDDETEGAKGEEEEGGTDDEVNANNAGQPTEENQKQECQQ